MVTKTSQSDAYVLGVTKSKIIQDTYKVIYTLVNKDVSDTRSPARSKWIYPSFPDKDIDDADAYPIVIVNSPAMNWDKFTLKKKYAELSIRFEIYATKSSTMDQISDDLIDAIETNRDTLQSVNLRFVNLESTDSDMVMRDQIKVHYRTLNFAMKYSFTGTL